MTKPVTLDGYSDQHTVDCERVLVTLLRRLGPWKESVLAMAGSHRTWCVDGVRTAGRCS